MNEVRPDLLGKIAAAFHYFLAASVASRFYVQTEKLLLCFFLLLFMLLVS